MKWVGLTGGIASGKSTVVQSLRKHQIPIVDADELAKMVVAPGSPGLKSVVHEFGSEVLSADGSLNRRILGQRVFGNKERLDKLQSILHPLIRIEVDKIKKDLEQKGCALAIYDIPLLFESQAQDQFDLIVVVTCSLEQQRQRMAARDELSAKEIEDRLAAQLPLEVKEKEADFIVHNDGDLKNLQVEIQKLLSWLKSESTLKV